MASLDLFNSTTVESPRKETTLPNTTLDLSTLSGPVVNTTIEPIVNAGFVLNEVPRVSEDMSSDRNNSPVYFGKSFEYLGPWTEGTMYYNDDYRQSYVTYNNCLLACNKTHEATESLEPVLQYNTAGVVIAVENIYWSVVLKDDPSANLQNLNSSITTLQETVANNTTLVNNNTNAINVLGQNLNNIMDDIDEVTHPWVGTEEEYAALTWKDPNRLYYIVEDEQTTV